MISKLKNASTIKRAFLIFTVIVLVVACTAGCSPSADISNRTEGAAEKSFRNQMANSGIKEIAVKEDLVLEAPVEVNGTKVLYGEGSITAVRDGWTGDEYMLLVQSGAQLTVKGSVSINAEGIAGGIHVAQGAKWSIEESASVKNASAKAANALVEGVFQMKGGTLSGAMGHNVRNMGEVILSGGEIIGSGMKYAGIYSEGTLTQNGGTVRDAYNNVAVIAGSFGFQAGSNQNSVHDGIYVAEGAKLSVADKSAAVTGAGVRGIYLCGEAAIQNITLSTSGDSLIKVAQTGTLNLDGGTLTDAGYHSVENAGKMVMTGGTISNSYNCGIVNTGELEVFGGNFMDNVNNKAVLNKHNGKATVSGQSVMFSGNRFALANEDTATLDLSGASILLTTGTNVYAYDGTVNIHDISLGASGSNNVRIYKAEVSMTNVQVLGNSASGSSTTHGILLEGGALTAKDVSITNVTGYGIRNKGGHIIAENLLISKSIKAGGINNTVQDHTGLPGVADIKNLTIEDIRYNNVVVEGGTLTVTNGEFKASGTNNTKITDGTLKLKSVEIYGNLPDTEGTNHAVYATGGTLVAEDVKIQDAKVSGLRVNGETAVISGSNVSVENSPKYGIDLTAGQISIQGLTMAGNHYNINNNGGHIQLSDSTLGATVSNNVRMSSGTIDLRNVVINGHTPDHTDNVHALFLDNGKLTGEKITVQNVSNVGLRVKGGTADIQGLTVEDAGTDGVWIDGGKAMIHDLVVKKAGGAGVSATNAGDITVIGGIIHNTVSHGVKSEGEANLTLKDIFVAIATTDGRHAVLAQGGDIHLENVKITGNEQNTTGFGIRINRDTSHVSGKNVHIADVNTGISAVAGTSDIFGLTTQNITAHSVYAASAANLIISDSEFGITGTNNAKAENGGILTLNNTVINGTVKNHGLMVENGGYLYAKDITVRDTAGCAVRVKCGDAGNSVEIDGLITENIGTHNVYINKDKDAGNVGSIVIKNSDLGRTSSHSVLVEAGKLTLIRAKFQGHLSDAANNIHTVYVCSEADEVKLEDVTVLEAAGDALRVAAGDVVAANFVSKQTGRNGVWVDGGSLTADDLIISGSKSVGFNISGGTAVLNGVDISGCASNVIAAKGELAINGYADGSKSRIGTSTEDNVKATGTGVIRLSNVTVDASAKNNVVAIDGGTVYVKDSDVTGGNHSVLADRNGKVYLGNVQIRDSVTSGIRANSAESYVEATDVTIDGAKIGLNIKCGTIQISNITIQNTKENGIDLRQGDADANVTLNGLVTENCGIHAIYTSGAAAKLTVSGAALGNDGSDHIINLNGGPMTLNDVTIHSENLAAGKYELYSGAGWLTIGGEMDANIFIATNPGRVIKVNKELTGNNLVVDWQNAPAGNALEFADADMMNASKDNIALGSVQGAVNVLIYEGKAATLEALEIYTTVNSWNELKTMVSAMTSGSYMEYRIEGSASDWVANESMTLPEGVQVMVSAGQDAPAIVVASGVSPFTFGENTVLTLENLIVGGTESAKAEHIIVPKTATLSLISTTLQYFKGERGGAVHINCGTLNATGSTFANNSNPTNWGGAIGVWGGTAQISESLFIGNTSKYSGGAIINYKADGGSYGGTTDNTVGNLTLTDCVFTNNSTQEHGGAVASWANGTTTITGCEFGDESDAAKGNRVTKNGGAIHVQDGHNMSITNCKFFHNSATADGGAIFAQSSVKLSVTDSAFQGNAAKKNGGAILVGKNTEVRNSTFTGNSGYEGGAISVTTGSTLTLHDVICTDNTTTRAFDLSTYGYGDIRVADNRKSKGGTVSISGKIVATIWNNQAHSVQVVGALTEGSLVTVDWRLNKLQEDTAKEAGILFVSEEIMNASKAFIRLGIDASTTEGWQLRYSEASPWKATLVKE